MLHHFFFLKITLPNQPLLATNRYAFQTEYIIIRLVANLAANCSISGLVTVQGALTPIMDPAFSVFSRLTSSPQAKAATAIAVSAIAVLAVAIGLHKVEKETKIRTLKKSIPTGIDSGNVRHPFSSA